MAYLRRYRRSSRRPVRRVSRFSRYTRRFNRNMLAAYQQRDAGRFTIRLRSTVTITVPTGSIYGYAVVNIWNTLAYDPQYLALNALFDQVKINGARLTCVSRVMPNISTTLLPIYTYAWDRNGREGTGTASEDFDRVASYGSSHMHSLTPASRNNFTTSIVAQDIQERSQYISTDDIKNVSETSELAQSFFKPVFLIAVRQPVTDNSNSNDYIWDMDVAVDLTFRGTRYCKASNPLPQ